MATRTWIFPAPAATDVEDVAAVRIETMAGSIEIEEHEAAHVHVAIDDVSGPPVQMTLGPERLLVSHAPSGVEGMFRRLLPSRASGRVRIRLFVPAGVPVSVSAGAAETHVADVTEDVDLAATSGRVTLIRCGAAAHVRTRGGDIVVRQHDGDVALTTASGRSDVQGAMPLAEFSTGTGDVWVVNTAVNHRTSVTSLGGSVNIRVLRDVQLRLKALRLGGRATVDGHGVDLGGSEPYVEGEGPDLAEVQVSMITGGLAVRRDVARR